MTIQTLPTSPSRTRPSTFSAEMDAMLAALPQFVSDVNSTEATWVLTNVTATSTTSTTIGTGSKTIAVGTGKAFVAGVYVFLINSAAPANYMYGSVSSYSSGNLTVNVTSTSGSGTAATWAVHPAGVPGTSSLSGGTAGALPWQSGPSTTSFTSAGAAGEVLVSGGTGTPTWTGAPTATSAAKFDNSTKLATTAFVKEEGHQYKTHSNISSGALTLTAATHSGASLSYVSGSSSTWTLPAANSMGAGSVIRIAHQGGASADLTVNRAGSDTLSVNSTSVTSVVLHAGDVLELVSSGGTLWSSIHSVKWAVDATLPNIGSSMDQSCPYTAVYPRDLKVFFKNVTSDAGYAAGDIIPAYYTNGSYGAPVQVVFSAGVVKVLPPSDATAWCIPHKTTRSMTNLTAANWQYRVIAEF